MVVTVPKADAPYQGFQLGSMWYISLDYINHQTSLNAAQAQVDPDGQDPLVVSERDPGVANWIETHRAPPRLSADPLAARLPRADADDGPAVRGRDVRRAAGRCRTTTSNTITPDARAERIAARQAAVADRMLG